MPDGQAKTDGISVGQAAALGVIVVILTVVTVASLIATKKDPSRTAKPGSLKARKQQSEQRG